MSGAESTQTAKILQHQVDQMLNSGGFELRKYASNCSELLRTIAAEKREIDIPLNVDKDDILKTLGLFWHPAKDIFNFKVTLNETQCTPTKRALLSQIARLFDPIGWISPTIILAKILIQKLWIKGLQWDDPVPEHIAKEWTVLRNELHLLQEIQIPRWMHITQESTMQIHGFADASTVAYCAVVYSRVVTATGAVKITLLTAKSKVAPVKPVTLPRLELCAAVLLAKLVHTTISSLQINNPPIFAWTDSMIALSWIHGKPNQWKTFVCNRVAEIHEHIEPNCWRHVSSADNPADCGSRGLLPSMLRSKQLWWQGPQWLPYENRLWPPKVLSSANPPEAKVVKVYATTLSSSFAQDMSTKYSSWLKILRVTAFCFRFAHNCSTQRNERHIQFLTTKELQHAEMFLIKTYQADDFGDEIHNLQQNKSLHSKSKILCLNPFVDHIGVLRVGGRLANSVSLRYSEKHPIILSNKNRATYLLCKQYHFSTLHGGPSLMAAVLRRKFWIIHARNLLRRVTHECMTCFRQKGQPLTQLMGNLPEPRIEISRPFTHTGVDYAGPLSIRMSRHTRNRNYKGYVAIFICLCTKAVHLEAVSDLTAETFLAALRRFIARRGLCSHIYSDCGRNFIGADSRLRQMFEQTLRDNANVAASHLAHQNITWHFIPPASPHFGGLWEAGVKSMKHHLKRAVGDTVLTFEELATLLAQIEACLNSRPLAPMSNDCSDGMVLTPGHFLTGDSLLAPPENNILQEKINFGARWELVKRMHQQFWKAWSTEFLTRLQSRPKWIHPQKNIEEGALVLIKDDGLPPLKWSLGRVTKTFPGNDGLIRVASVKTQTGECKRPISKLCLLPIPDESYTQ